MKTINIFFSLIIILGTSFFVGCSDNDKSPALTNIESGELDNLSVDAIVLKVPEKGANPLLITITWTETKFSLDKMLPVAPVRYRLEADKAGNNFANPVPLAAATDLFANLYVNDINTLLLGQFGAEPGEAVHLELRLVTTYGEEVKSENKVISSKSIPLTLTPFEPPKEEGGITIRWKQVEGNWAEFAIYAWGDSEIFGKWPGKVVQPDAKGWYSVVVPSGNFNLILNNNGGGNQFDFLTNPTESGSYEVHTRDGNNTSTFERVDIIIRWKYVGSDWTAFGIYAWDGSPVGETFGPWPGTIVTPDANGWCRVVVLAGQKVGNVIFNNTTGGAGNQFDLNMEITSSICFQITSGSATVVDCQ